MVDPDELVLFGSGTAAVPECHHIVGFYFAVGRARTTGSLEAGDDARDARFFTMPEVEAVDKHGSEEQVDHVQDLVNAAVDALDGKDREQTE